MNGSPPPPGFFGSGNGMPPPYYGNGMGYGPMGPGNNNGMGPGGYGTGPGGYGPMGPMGYGNNINNGMGLRGNGPYGSPRGNRNRSRGNSPMYGDGGSPNTYRPPRYNGPTSNGYFRPPPLNDPSCNKCSGPATSPRGPWSYRPGNSTSRSANAAVRPFYDALDAIKRSDLLQLLSGQAVHKNGRQGEKLVIKIGADSLDLHSNFLSAIRAANGPMAGGLDQQLAKAGVTKVDVTRIYSDADPGWRANSDDYTNNYYLTAYGPGNNNVIAKLSLSVNVQ